MTERTLEIVNSLGMHARPAAQLVRLAARFQSEVEIAKDGMAINGKSIMGVMMLAAGLGVALKLRTEGPDEAAAMAALVDLFERKFDEGQ